MCFPCDGWLLKRMCHAAANPPDATLSTAQPENELEKNRIKQNSIRCNNNNKNDQKSRAHSSRHSFFAIDFSFCFSFIWLSDSLIKAKIDLTIAKTANFYLRHIDWGIWRNKHCGRHQNMWIKFIFSLVEAATKREKHILKSWLEKKK